MSTGSKRKRSREPSGNVAMQMFVNGSPVSPVMFIAPGLIKWEPSHAAIVDPKRGLIEVKPK